MSLLKLKREEIVLARFHRKTRGGERREKSALRARKYEKKKRERYRGDNSSFSVMVALFFSAPILGCSNL